VEVTSHGEGAPSDLTGASGFLANAAIVVLVLAIASIVAAFFLGG
jgi:hypothetical protein